MPNTDLPDEIREPAADTPQDEPKLDRRTAIAQARAIRRGAAAMAMDESIKAQAAETASTILEQAEPEPPKAPLHKQTAPQPVSNTTGKFGWLDEVSPSEPERPAAHTDTDALLEELRAESRARRTAAKSAGQDGAPAAAEISGEEIADAADFASEADAAEADDAEAAYTDDAEYGDDKEYDEYDDDTAYSDDTEYDDDTEYADDAYDGDAPEDQVIRELHVTNETAPMRSPRAAAEYQAVTADAKPFVRRLAKETEKKWKKEAGTRRAEETIRRTERTSAKWNIAVCLLLLFGIAVYNLVLERPVKSMKENRMLAKMPSFSNEDYLSGKYTSGVELYYNDTVPHRDDFKEMTQVIRKHMGLSGNAVLIGDLPAAQQPDPESPAETTAPPVTTAEGAVTAQTLTTVSAAVTTTAPPADDEPEREGEMGDNGVLIVNKRGIMLFGGWETMGENYAHILSRFKESAPDINMYSMVIPTVCSFYTPEEFQHLITSEKANIDYINKTLVGVTPIDVYGALEKHKDEPIFMRTDHHWSSLGAFYACEAFSAEARVPFARIEEYDRKSKDDYVGTLYTFSNNIILKENPEEFFWYIPRAHFTTTFYNNSFGNPREGDYFMNIDNVAPVSYYMVYMAGDDHIVRVQTDVHNGRRLCIIKDSYGNALAPWLTSSFEEIYIIDMRYFQLNAISFLREHGMTDVLFAMNTFSANGDNGAKVEKIRTQ